MNDGRHINELASRLSKLEGERNELQGQRDDLLAALKVVCKTLAAERDGEQLARRGPDTDDTFSLEELKYMIVDRAIELVEPGFDGGETTAEELRQNIREWTEGFATIAKTEGRA